MKLGVEAAEGAQAGQAGQAASLAQGGQAASLAQAGQAASLAPVVSQPPAKWWVMRAARARLPSVRVMVMTWSSSAVPTGRRLPQEGSL
jgi:hypothetical protein